MVLVCNISSYHDDHLCQFISLNPTIHEKVIGRKRTGFIETYAQSLRATVTLNFNLATWFLFETHRLIIIIIYAKLFLNSTMHNKVMGRTSTGFTEVYAHSLRADCDLDLWPSDMVLVRDTSSFVPYYFQIQLCITKLWVRHEQVSLKSMQKVCGLWPSDMVLCRNTSSCHGDHLCQIIFKSHHVQLSYGPDKYTHTQVRLFLGHIKGFVSL